MLYLMFKDPPALGASSSSATLIGGTVGGVIAFTLLAVVAVALLAMWLTRRRNSYELNGYGTGIAFSNAIYGGEMTESLSWLPQQIIYMYKKMIPIIQ